MSYGNYSNPYANTPSTPGSPQGPVNISNKVLGPGIALIVVGSLGLLLMGGYFVLTLIGLATNPEMTQPPPGASDGERTGFFIGFYGMLCLLAFSPFMQLFVIWGGINFLRQRGRSVAMFACIVSLIPCVSSLCLLGIPFGIWGLFVLADNQVRTVMKGGF